MVYFCVFKARQQLSMKWQKLAPKPTVLQCQGPQNLLLFGCIDHLTISNQLVYHFHQYSMAIPGPSCILCRPNFARNIGQYMM